ncbi:MAG: hypothetical protein J7518_22120 [Nocardioidaceae bacterium]|nr:hypothetical protein [Nocardioidaceae bacterium]
MSQVVATVRSLPFLTPEQTDALPRPRDYALRQALAALAAIVTLVGIGWLDVVHLDGLETSRLDTARHFAIMVAPWLVLLPWLRHFDIRPVHWFFLCLLLGWVFAPLLVGRFVGRALALPYRDWEVEYWHAARARRVPGVRAWVLAPAADAGPYHRPPGERTLRAGWVLVVVTAIPALVVDAGSTHWTGQVWLGCFVTMMIASLVSFRLDRRRLDRVVAQPDQADDGQAGGEERERQQ